MPSARELRALGASALASVPSFTVAREGFGSVEWDGPVDLSAVRVDDLFDIVRITRGEVAVYAGRASALKPPRGAGLNRPATITLLGVFPDARERLELYKKNGSTFVSYEPTKGAWTFKVAHFSRYGMDLDASDSEEEEDDVMEIPEERGARAEARPSDAEEEERRRRNDFDASDLVVPRTPGAVFPNSAANRDEFVVNDRDGAANKSWDLNPTHTKHRDAHVTGSPFGGGPAADAFAAAASARQAAERARKKSRVARRSRRPPAAATAYAIAASVTNDVGYAKPLDLPLLPRDDTKPKLTDAHYLFGASFRPSWGPAGRLAHAGRTEARQVATAGGYAAASASALVDRSPHAPCARVVSERFAPCRRNGDAAALRAALEVALDMTVGASPGDESSGEKVFGARRALRCSRLDLPGLCDRYMRAVSSARLAFLSRASPRNADPAELAMEVSAWDLVKTLWGDEPGGAPAGSAADRHRRRAGVGAWLRKHNGAASDDGVAAKVATGAFVAATRAAAASGHPRLATLIAQGGCGGAGGELASAQLHSWRGGAVETYVPASVSSVLGVLAGEVAPPRADLFVRDWRVNFGLHVWHGASPTATIARVLDGYLDAVADGAAARPDAPGFTPTDERNARDSALPSVPIDARADRLKETCFNLLVLFSTGAALSSRETIAELRKMFHPLTYCAADLANAAFAWHVFGALRASGALGDGPEVERLGDDLAVRFACQLDGFDVFGDTGDSLAEWTVFVLMHVADGPRRADAARAALHRRCAEWRTDERKKTFLVENAGVPRAWLEDAEARFLKFHATRYDVSS